MTITYRAWDTSANTPKTGDSANHTLKWIKDGTSSATTNSPSEVDSTNAKGVYKITMTSTETDCTFGVLAGVSSTANIAIFGVQIGFDYIPNAAAGAANGILIAGTNAATTFSSSGDALTITSTGGNGNGINISGNGSGNGIKTTGGATGQGFSLIGGGTSGAAIGITTTSGDGISITPTAGNAITATANGTSKHGIVATGGTGGTSDGIKAVAGTGGVDIRGNITGNVTGNLSGSAGSVTAGITVSTNNDKTGYSLTQAFPTNFSSIAITAGGIVQADLQTIKTQSVTCAGGVTVPAATLASTTNITSGTITTATNLTTNNDKTGYSLTQAFPTNFSSLAITGGGAITVGSVLSTASNIKKNTALAGFMFLMTDSTTHAPKTGLTVAGTVSLDGGGFIALTNSVSEVSGGWYKVSLAAGDVNGNTVALRFTAANADDRDILIITTP